MRVALAEPWRSLGGALVEPWWSLGGALGCLSVGYQQALGWHWGGFGWPWPAVQGSRFEVQSSVFYRMQLPSRSSLVVVWRYPGHTLVPQHPLRIRFLISLAYLSHFPASLPPRRGLRSPTFSRRGRHSAQNEINTPKSPINSHRFPHLPRPRINYSCRRRKIEEAHH